jgi:hypothetical protein
MGLADIINGAGGLLGSSPSLLFGGRRGGKSTMATSNQERLRQEQERMHELDAIRYAMQQQQAQQPHTLTPGQLQTTQYPFGTTTTTSSSGTGYTQWSGTSPSYNDYLDDTVKEKKKRHKNDVERVIDEEVNRIRNL